MFPRARCRPFPDFYLAHTFLVERAVQQNLFHQKQLRYRECPVGDEALLASTADGAGGGGGEVNLDAAALAEGSGESASHTTNGGAKPHLKVSCCQTGIKI